MGTFKIEVPDGYTEETDVTFDEASFLLIRDVTFAMSEDLWVAPIKEWFSKDPSVPFTVEWEIEPKPGGSDELTQFLAGTEPWAKWSWTPSEEENTDAVNQN